jgi:hypothetical protein
LAEAFKGLINGFEATKVGADLTLGNVLLHELKEIRDETISFILISIQLVHDFAQLISGVGSSCLQLLNLDSQWLYLRGQLPQT